MFEQGKVYILEGRIFDSETLEVNDNKFTYNGIDPDDESYEFVGVVSKGKQWVFPGVLALEDSVWVTVVPA